MKYSLNHVWIQAVRLEKSGAITCPIPEALMANVRDIAKNHNKTPVNIWVDICGVGQTDVDVITQLNAEATQPNITFKSLDTIEKYVSDPLFKKDPKKEKNLLWDQIDIARVLVIEHLLKQDNQAAIYADMDMDICGRHFRRAIKILNEHGGVVGLESHEGGLENQFFGFTPEKRAFVSDVVLREDDFYWEYYDVFLRSFDAKHAEPYGLEREKTATPIYEIPTAPRIKRSYQTSEFH